MSHRGFGSRWVVLAAVFAGLAAGFTGVEAGEDARTAVRFIEDLRDHGLHELARDYIHQLGEDASLPAKVKEILAYEEARTLIDEAAKSNDLVLREDLLKEARDMLGAFVKAHPDLVQTRDAMVQTGKLLLERGHTAMLLSEDAADPAKKAAKVAEARAAFGEARDAYKTAIEPLKAAHKKFAGFLEKDDPRLAERDAVYALMLDAMLQQGVADYEMGETFPPGSPERIKALKDAIEQFDVLYKNHREQWGGLTARMWQGKCYEEQNEIGSAIAIYKELMGHTDPKLRQLQRNVGYFYIVALSRRQQHALAADEASRWLATYNRREERRSSEGLGVLIEYAKDLDAQVGGVSGKEREKAVKLIIDSVSEVVRYSSPYKKDALALLKKYKPTAALKAEELANLNYEDAMGKAEEAIGSHEWERAIAFLKAAIRKAALARNTDNLNLARYHLAFCYFMNKQYYEADVLAEHLARRYPQGGVSAKATQIAMQALVDAYNNYAEFDRQSDLERFLDLAHYTAKTWPDKEEGDEARINLSQVYIGRGEYDQAIAYLTAVRRRSRQWIDAQNRLGAAHWAKSRDLDRRGNSAGAETETRQALDLLNVALAARREAGAGPSDPGFVNNVGDLATILSETGKPDEALKVLDPVVKAQTVKSGPGYSRLLEAQLKALITSGKVEPAIASMKALEQAGGAAGRAQLYLKLGKLLKKELEALQAKGKTADVKRMNLAYKTFLTTLVDTKTGQTFESLIWAGDALLTIEAYEDAEKVYQRVLTEFGQNSQFLDDPNGRAQLKFVRARLASALRGQKKYDEAGSLLEELMAQKPAPIKILFENGLLLEAEAEAGRKSWAAALRQWEDLTKMLERARPRPEVYYDAWYHVAWAFFQQKSTTKARQALLGVMRLSPNVGGPEMKAKYQGLLARLK
jgi:tetratricopeptide (TPR) repeat protein